jgi:hypothetical protein
MGHACKRLAMRAQKNSFDPAQIVEAVCPSLEAHWALEVPKDLVKVVRELCENRQASLFDNDNQGRFERVRRENAAAGSLGRVFLDCIEQALSAGKVGDDAMRSAAYEALLDRAARDARSIDEHYIRESSSKVAVRVNARILDAIGRAPIETLARDVVARAANANRVPVKHDGLDEGVSLP